MARSHQRPRKPLYSNYDNKNRSFFPIFNRSIRSVIYNLECMIAKSWSAFSKTPVFQFRIQFNVFAYFSWPYCIRHFEFRKSNRKILISDVEKPLYTIFKQNLSFPRTFDHHLEYRKSDRKMVIIDHFSAAKILIFSPGLCVRILIQPVIGWWGTCAECTIH